MIDQRQKNVEVRNDFGKFLTKARLADDIGLSTNITRKVSIDPGTIPTTKSKNVAVTARCAIHYVMITANYITDPSAFKITQGLQKK